MIGSSEVTDSGMASVIHHTAIRVATAATTRASRESSALPSRK
jgi:hypothetical protein